MKNTRKNQTLTTLAFIVPALVLITSCRKTAEELAALFTESEAAEIVETAVSSRSAGITMPAVDIAKIIENQLNNCGVPGDTSLQKSNSNTFASYDYIFGLEWLMHCNTLGIPTDASVNINGNGSFSTARWSGSDATTGSLTFTGLNPQETAYLVNGAYTLTGDLTGDLRRIDPTFHCTTTIALTNLTISKSTYKITGGAGTVQIAGTNGQGNTRSLDGTLTFNGDGTVTVVLNGHAHTFPL